MRSRKGFTLIEMMVVMALTMFIMVILSEAFIIGMDTFLGLKAIGDMQDNLRSAVLTMRGDLAAPHFDGSRRLSDSDIATNRPRSGFFSILKRTQYATSVPNPSKDGIDADRLYSYSYNDYILHFTSRLDGSAPDKLYSAVVPTSLATPGPPFQFMNYSTVPNVIPINGATDPLFSVTQAGPAQVYKSPWAEVAYVLEKTGNTEIPDDPSATITNAAPLFSLKRYQAVLVPQNNSVNGALRSDIFNSNAMSSQNNLLDLASLAKFDHDRTSFGNNTNTVDFLTPDDMALGTYEYFDSSDPTKDVCSKRTFELDRYDGFFPRVANNFPLGSPLRQPVPYRVERNKRYQRVLENVLSMEVEVLRDNLGANANFEQPLFNNAKPNLGVHPIVQMYDTAPLRIRQAGAPNDPDQAISINQSPYNGNLPVNQQVHVTYPIHALRITLRIWDPKTRQARQTSFVQQM